MWARSSAKFLISKRSFFGGFWTSCRQCQHLNNGCYLFLHLKSTFSDVKQTKYLAEIVNAECYQTDNQCTQWAKTLMPTPRRWCNPPLWSDRGFVCNLCPAFVNFLSRLNGKIRVPRLLVTVRVICLFHTASKCTQTYHFGPKIFFSEEGITFLHHTPPLSASTAPHRISEILNKPLIGLVRPAQNEAVQFVFQLVLDKVTTVHKSTTYNNKLYNIQQSIQNQTSPSARCSPAIWGQLNLCTAPRLPLQGQHLQWHCNLSSALCDLDLWPTDLKADRFTPLPVDHLCQFASNQFNHFQHIVLTSLVTDGWTDKLSNRLRTHCLCLSVWPGGAIMRADT